MADEGVQNETKRSFGANMRETWQRVPQGRRWLILGGGLAVVALLAVVIASGGEEEPWRPVARDLLPEDVEAARKAFDEKKIPYKLGGEGTILVPPENIHDARLELAVSSMPSGRSVGFELFDESGMGRSAFTEKVNLHRALEGELARTIRHIEGIERVRVHLVTPERRVFRDLEVAPSASVVVSLKHGTSLTRDSARAIQQLVAGAVERLTPNQVAIVDQYGKMIAGPEEGPVSGAAFEHQRAQENELEERVIRLLEPIIGAQKVMAKVAIELDFSQVVETREDYDPEQQVVRSEREQLEKSTEAETQPLGPPGTVANDPTRQVGATARNEVQTGREKSDTIRNYEVDKTVRRTENPVPRLKRISVAVVVDEAPDGKGGVKPRTPEEIAQIKRLAERAVGLDASRGDTIEVTSAPFAPLDGEPVVAPLGEEAPEGKEGVEAPPKGPPWYEDPMVLWIAAGAGGLLLFVLLIWLIARRVKRRKKAKAEEAAAEAQLQAETQEPFADYLDTVKQEQLVDRRTRITELRERAVGLANEDIHRLSVVFQRWFDSDKEPEVEKEPAPEVRKEAA
jgi:flagellar M-ring protein FliF